MAKLFGLSILVSLIFSLVTAAPAPRADNTASNPDLSTHQSGGETYIVLFNSSHPDFPHVADVLSRVDLHADHEDVHTIYNNTVFRGFCASMKSHCIDALNSMPDVAVVEKAGIVSIADVRTGAPWGLQRISSATEDIQGDSLALDYSYSFEPATKLGQGVDIYSIDTGINTDHLAFGGRAKMIFPDANSFDDNGHGTHTAGTAAANVFGVASAANLWGIKVLDAAGTGPVNTTLAGFEKAITSHQERSKQPGFVGSVITMSLSFADDNQQSQAMRLAVYAANDAGIHMTLAAGNNFDDACAFSPGENGGVLGPAITVGAIGMGGVISVFSNTGKCVDVYAPGEDVVSAWIETSATINHESGTSQATPHVAGIVATLMVENATLAKSPALMKAHVQNTALRNLVRGNARSGDKGLLANNESQQ
jgi:cerevisin